MNRQELAESVIDSVADDISALRSVYLTAARREEEYSVSRQELVDIVDALSEVLSALEGARSRV